MRIRRFLRWLRCLSSDIWRFSPADGISAVEASNNVNMMALASKFNIAYLSSFPS